MLLTFSIVYAGALVWISALAQHVGNLTSHGMQWVAGDRSQAVADDGFPGRASRALRNNLESAAMWVPIGHTKTNAAHAATRTSIVTPRGSGACARYFLFQRAS